MIDGGKLAPVVVIAFGKGEFVDLRTVLERSRFDFERSRVEVLVDASAVIPVFGDTAVDVERELLHAEVVALVVEGAVKSLFAQLGEGVDGITDVTGRDGRLGDFEQPHVAQTGIGAPQGIDRVGVGGVGHEHTVFEHVDIGRREADLYFARAVGTGGVEHHVTIPLFLRGRSVVGLIGVVLLLCPSVSAG